MRMKLFTNTLIRLGILRPGLDYHLIRASMVIIFIFFGYQRWFKYAAQPMIRSSVNGALDFWMSSFFGVRGAGHFLGVSEWLFGALLFAGFWNKKLGILGAAGSAFTFLASIVVIPFMPERWAAWAGWFAAVPINVACLVKDLALLAVSVYLLRQDVMRVSLSTTASALELGSDESGDLERLAVALQIWCWNNRRRVTVQKDS